MRLSRIFLAVLTALMLAMTAQAQDAPDSNPPGDGGAPPSSSGGNETAPSGNQTGDSSNETAPQDQSSPSPSPSGPEPAPAVKPPVQIVIEGPIGLPGKPVPPPVNGDVLCHIAHICIGCTDGPTNNPSPSQTNLFAGYFVLPWTGQVTGEGYNYYVVCV